MSDNDLTVGWIGAGRMGAAMASRLAEAGVGPPSGTGPGPRPKRPSAYGCTVADDVAQPARPRRGLHDGLHAGRPRAGAARRRTACSPIPAHLPGAVVDCSTVSTESSELIRAQCAGRGVAFLAAPVSGNGKVVEAGGLSLVVSGPEATFHRVEPLLRHIGRSVTYVGDGDVARLVKICHNLMLGVVTQCLAEITVLAEKGGVSRAAFLEFLNDSVMGSVFTRYKSPAFVHLDYTPDLHADPAAQGLRPRPGRRARAGRADAGGRAHRPAGAADGVQRPGHRGLRHPARPAGRGLGPGAQAGGHPGGRRALLMSRPHGRSRPHGGRLRAAGRLRPAAAIPAGPGRALDGSECGAFLLFDFYNIRYTTQTWIGGALGDKMTRYRAADPRRRSRRCGTSAPPRGTTGCTRRGWCPTGLPRRDARPARRRSRRTPGLIEDAVREMKGLLEDAGVADLPVGVDIVEPRSSSRCSARACAWSTPSS